MKNHLSEIIYKERTTSKYHEDPDPRGVWQVPQNSDNYSSNGGNGLKYN